MSVDLQVMLNRCDLPTAEMWRAELNRLGVPVVLSDITQVEQHSGFLPATIDGEDTGFEFDLTSQDATELPDGVIAEVHDKDSIAYFSFSEDAECIAALASATALARLSKGIIFDPSTGEILSYDNALAQTRLALSQFRKKLREAESRGKTPAMWAKNCLSFLQEIHPSYRRNSEVKGRFIEFIREDDSGLFISHNFIKIRDDYHYSFALTFLTRPTTLLTHCMLAGSRFDNNRTIWRQFYDDMGLFRNDPGYPAGVWSSGPWRSNTMENLRHGVLVPEKHLYPFYRRELCNGKKALVTLLEDAQQILDRIPIGAEEEEICRILHVELENIKPLHRECFGLDGLRIARGGKCQYKYGPPEPGFIIESVPRELIVVSQLSVFLQERDRLDEIIKIAKNL